MSCPGLSNVPAGTYYYNGTDAFLMTHTVGILLRMLVDMGSKAFLSYIAVGVMIQQYWQFNAGLKVHWFE